MDSGVGRSSFDEALRRIIEMLDYDEDEGRGSSSSNLSDQMLPSSPSSFAPFNGMQSMEQYFAECFRGNDIARCSLLDGEDINKIFQQMDPQIPIPIQPVNDVGHLIEKGYTSSSSSVIPRPLKQSLDDRMMRAMYFFNGLFGGATLAQMWVPMKNHDNQYMLSTCEQPFLHDQALYGYRELSKLFTFAAEPRPGSFPGLPGRVFASKVPEWTPSVAYYNITEYLRVDHAADHNVHGSIAVPVFEGNSLERPCCAVLELVTTEEKPNFDQEMDKVCQALKAVNLSSSRPPRLYPQRLSKNQNAALVEIKGILHDIGLAHRLPVALTWIPCSYVENAGHESIRVHVRSGHTIATPNEKPIMCVAESACFSRDRNMAEFVHACADHFLEEGQGIVGKTLQSNQPFFHPDVKNFHVSEYPLVQHARKSGLSAAIAIRLRSTHTGANDYILEFFLPVNMRGDVEKQLFLNKIASTMGEIYRSLRKVPDIELFGEMDSKVELLGCGVKNIPPIALSMTSSERSIINGETNSNEEESENVCELKTTQVKDVNPPPKKAAIGRVKQIKKQQSICERYISLSELQQYYPGSLKEAAKNLGVCPSTIKKVCRQYGISRWPSRKLNKVNRSLKQIKTVLDSVQGVEGGLRFDPTSGKILAAGSLIQVDLSKSLWFAGKNDLVRDISVLRNSISASSTSNMDCEGTDVRKNEENASSSSSSQGDQKGKGKAPLAKTCDDASLSATMPGTTPPTAPKDSFLPQGGYSGWEPCLSCQKTKNPESRFVSECSSSMIGGDEMEKLLTSSDVIVLDGSSSSSGSFDERSPLREEVNLRYGEHTITMKATYKENTVRMKLEPTAGCAELYRAVAKRFNLQIGRFHLKYLDDDEEWMAVVTDEDLAECIEVLDFIGYQTVKFQVVDDPSAMMVD